MTNSSCASLLPLGGHQVFLSATRLLTLRYTNFSADGGLARERSLSYFSAASGGEDSGPMNVNDPTQAVESEQPTMVDQAMRSPHASTPQDLGNALYGTAAVHSGRSNQMLAEPDEAWIIEAQDAFASAEACVL